MNEHLPIIKIELEGMRLSIARMLSEYQVQFSEEVNRAIERFCSSEYLQRVIDAEVRHNIEYVVKDAIGDYYRLGKGRQIIIEEVIKRLSKENEEIE